MGLEATPQEWVDKMVAVADGVWRVLRDDGTFWINVGDSYVSTNATVGKVSTDGLEGGRSAPINNGTQRGITATAARSSGLKPKDLCLMPFRLALALQEAGWYVRSDICWAKKSSMPESVTDRPTSAWEHVFLLSKQAKYYYDAEAVRVPLVGPLHAPGNLPRKTGGGQDFGDGSEARTCAPSAGANIRNFWLLGPEPYPEAHFATFPSEIPRRAILAGTSEKGVCAACGAPWRRVVEKGEGRCDRPHHPYAPSRPDGMTLRGGRLSAGESTTTGWEASCACEAGVVPATVIDPFMGSGTTAAVAQNLQRRWVGIELNAEYCDLAVKRIQTQAAQRRLAI